MVSRALPTLLLAFTLTAAPPPPSTRQASAVAYALEGIVLVRNGDGAPRALSLFEWLEPGTVVEVKGKGRLKLALSNGERFELSENAHATLREQRLEVVSGGFRKLPSVPAFVEIAPPIARTTGVPGGTRFRRKEIGKLSPAAGARVPVGPVELRFEPLDGLESIALEVQDADGRLVLESRIGGSPVSIPGELLSAGQSYVWCISGTVPGGFKAQGCGDFEVLSAEASKRIASLRTTLKDGSDPDDAALALELSRRSE